jgi:hypothetical protein
MPVTHSRQRILVVSITLLVLAAPAPASAGVMEVFQDLAERQLRPAPLVPISAPGALSPLDPVIETLRSRRRGGYGIRLAADSRGGPTVIALEGGSFPSIAAALRDFRRGSFKPRSTRVRGRRGYLLTRRLGKTDRSLLWSEGGRVYTLGSGTPRTISLRQLRATAEDLDPLVGAFIGSDANGEQEAFFVATQRTVTGNVAWTAPCTAPDGTSVHPRAGQANVTLHPKRGSEFTFDIAANLGGSNPAPWQGTVSGTVGTSGGTVNIRATTTVDPDTCDTGPVSFAVRPQR